MWDDVGGQNSLNPLHKTIYKRENRRLAHPEIRFDPKNQSSKKKRQGSEQIAEDERFHSPTPCMSNGALAAATLLGWKLRRRSGGSGSGNEKATLE